MKAAALILLVVPALATAQKVHIEFDESADFSKFQTFAWRGGRIQSKHPALDNSLVEKRIQNAVVARLTAKGLRETSERPDLGVAFVLGARDQKEVESVPAGWRGRRRRRVVHRYTQGTLVIDLRDAATRELVWRAVLTDTVSDPASFERDLAKDVAKAFEKFPPKKK